MVHYLCCCSYLGSAYRGFQVQVEDNTVCHVLQDAIEKVFGVRYDVKGCSRTDSGVHANAFCFSFFADKCIDPQRLPLALNAHLPMDVSVKAAVLVDDDFHARYDCMGKEYVYRIFNRRQRDPFLEGRAWLWQGEIDLKKMQEAAAFFVGRQDFTGFCGRKPEEGEDMVRTIHACEVTKVGDEIRIRVSGDGFLYHMVRIITGTLLQVGQGVYPPERVKEMLASKDRSLAGVTAPAHGLYLNKVFYEKGLIPAAEEGATWLK